MYICNSFGEMAEWSNAAVLKTVEGHTSGGSNPSFSAKPCKSSYKVFFIYSDLLNPFILNDLSIFLMNHQFNFDIPNTI